MGRCREFWVGSGHYEQNRRVLWGLRGGLGLWGSFGLQLLTLRMAFCRIFVYFHRKDSKLTPSWLFNASMLSRPADLTGEGLIGRGSGWRRVSLFRGRGEIIRGLRAGRRRSTSSLHSFLLTRCDTYARPLCNLATTSPHTHSPRLPFANRPHVVRQLRIEEHPPTHG